MRQSFLTILIIFTLFACQPGKTERQAEPDIYSVESDDQEMNNAIARSRETFNDFLSAFNSNNETQSAYAVKMPFPTENGAEHIWLVDIEINDGKMFGYIDNVPDQVSSVKLARGLRLIAIKYRIGFILRIIDWLAGLRFAYYVIE